MTEERQIVKKYENPIRNRETYNTATTTAEIWSVSSGKKAIITDAVVSTNTESEISIFFANTTTAIGPLFLSANDHFQHTFMEPVQGSTDENVQVTVSTGTASILLTGREE